MTELSKRLGEQVKRLRNARGLSQEKLADLANLHRDTVRRVESDKHPKDGPTLDTIDRLARGLELYPSELLAVADGSEDRDEDRDDEG